MQQKPFNQLNIFVPRPLLSNARNMAALTEIEENEMLVYENREVEINNFEVEELPLFLNSVLDRAESMISAGTTNMNEIRTCLLVD